MLLTCPNCQSGLQVPDGTTAMVRCPACKTVFSAADNGPPETEETEAEVEKRKPKARKPARDEDDEEKSRKKKAGKGKKADEEDEEEKPKEENRDFDPVSEEEDKRRKRKRKHTDRDETLTPEEKAERRAAFTRAAWGCRLIWISFALFMLSMLLIAIFYFQFGLARMITPSPIFITLAGVVGLFNWILAAIGVGLCLSGPRAPGHWGYGISAATATLVHGVFLLALVTQGKEDSIGKAVDKAAGTTSNVRLGLLPTRLDATMFYLTALLYPNEQGATPKGPMTLSMITGVLEMIRTVLIMMLLSCLSRAALDEDLAHKCTRASGVASGGPGIIAVLMLVFVATIIETNAGLNMFTMILFMVVNMGVYSILIGVIFPSFMAAREVTDACEEPFQSLIPKL